MTQSEKARHTAQELANSNNKTAYLYTDNNGEYVIFVLKQESFEGDPLTLVEIVAPEIAS